MAFIIEVPNPFQPLKGTKKHIHPGGVSIWSWLKKTYPGFQEFPLPTICLRNGEALLRRDWDQFIQPDDVINFITVPQGPVVALVISVILAAASIALSLILMPSAPPVAGEMPASDPVFSLKGQSNSIRLGEPIEVNYGRNRIYPSYAARPYYQYQDNDQYLFSLFCIGQGEYDISDIQIGDTAAGDYQEITTEVVPPGSDVTLFPTSVYSVPEVGNLTLLGPNEVESGDTGWVGPFAANPLGTQATQIQIDIVLPKGLYLMDSNGEIAPVEVTFIGMAREIDDDGNPLSDWSTVFDESITASTTTPQRRTYSVSVTAGRYEVKMYRDSDTNLSFRVGSDLVWDGLRSFLTAEQNWGDVTLLAVKAKATDNLNNRSQNLINVIATRKLPIYDSEGWSAEPVATRSIVWAFVDIFRSLYGGKVDSLYLDLDALMTLDALYTSRGDYFDFTFRDPSTVWEAARTVALVGRAIPLLSGSLITMKRDGPLTVPVALFNQDNIVEGSFQWSIKLWRLEDTDSLNAEYTEPDTGYKQEIVTADLGSGSSNPKDVRMLGIQDRSHAHREALYMLAVERYVREVITFDTGMEGFIPSYGDLILVAHDVPRWGQGGFVVQSERASDETRYHLWLSEPVDWGESDGESGDRVVMFRGQRGEVLGPYPAHQTSDPMQIEVDSGSEDVDFLLGGQNEPLLFLFGISSMITKEAKVIRVEPQGDEVVRITAVNYAPEVHTYDEQEPDALPEDTYPSSPPDLPTVSFLTLTQLSGVSYEVQAAWGVAPGANFYVLQKSLDGTNWTDRGATGLCSMVLGDLTPGMLYIRVAAVYSGIGPWVTTSIEVAPMVGFEVAAEWGNGLEWSVSWFTAPNALNYVVRVYDNSASEPVLKRETFATSPSYSYSYTEALADGNLVREMLVTVNPVYASGEYSNDPVTQSFSNPIPTAPTSPGSEISSEESDQIVYRLHWAVPHEEDLVRLRIWLSLDDGFDPAVTAPYIDEVVSPIGWEGIPTEAFVALPFESGGGHSDYYWRVAINDVWGEETSTNVTAQQTIPAHA